MVFDPRPLQATTLNSCAYAEIAGISYFATILEGVHQIRMQFSLVYEQALVAQR